MYKMFVFLKKTDDEEIKKIFKTNTVKMLEELGAKESHLAEVENSAMLEDKYSMLFELTTDTRDEMNELMTGQKGREFTLHVSKLSNNLMVMFANYEEE